MRILILVFLILVIFWQLSVGYGRVYAGDPIEKLGRGITNAATGWAEIPKEIAKNAERSLGLAALVVGPLKGLAKAIGRTAVGIYDVATFIIPLPRRYEPVIEPEYVF